VDSVLTNEATSSAAGARRATQSRAILLAVPSRCGLSARRDSGSCSHGHAAAPAATASARSRLSPRSL
jgi:hypothetical protein